MNKERLLKLADFLDKVPPGKFYYGRWASYNWDGRPLAECPSKACALGWATQIPEFAAAGLRIYREPDGDIGVTLSASEPTIDDVAIESFGAASKFFELDESDAIYLFAPDEDGVLGYSPGYDATASAVAAHIRRFVERGGMP